MKNMNNTLAEQIFRGLSTTTLIELARTWNNTIIPEQSMIRVIVAQVYGTFSLSGLIEVSIPLLREIANRLDIVTTGKTRQQAALFFRGSDEDTLPLKYTIVESLPQDQQDKIRPWLFGQTMPIIPGLEDKLCIYYSDYELFFERSKNYKNLKVF